MPNHFNLFLRDEKHRDAVERDQAPRLKRPGFVFILLFAATFGVIGVAGMDDGLTHIQAGVKLRRDSQTTQATVTSMYTQQNDGTDYYIIYDYYAPPDPSPHQRKTSIDSDDWRATCQGCKIEVRYSTASPEISRLPDEWPIGRGITIGGFMSLFLLSGLWGSWSIINDQRRYWRIRRRGKLRMGTILDASDEERGEDNDLHIMLQLQLDGDSAFLPYTWSDNTLRGKLPQVGQRVATLYYSAADFELI